jgi:L-iditol 2-dehydrogenase
MKQAIGRADLEPGSTDRLQRGNRLLVTDLSETRLEIARACGLQASSNARTETLAQTSKRCFGNDGFEVAFECVGLEATITAAIDSIQKGGSIIVVGVFGEQPRINLALVQDRELNLRGTLMYRREDYERAVELISSGGIQTAARRRNILPWMITWRLITSSKHSARRA